MKDIKALRTNHSKLLRELSHEQRHLFALYTDESQSEEARYAAVCALGATPPGLAFLMAHYDLSQAYAEAFGETKQ